MEPLYLTDVFGQLVSRVSASLAFCNPKIKQVYYIYGNPLEVADVLANDKENKQYDKYPLVILFTDITNTRGAVGYDSTVPVRIAIVNNTEHNYRAPKRMDVNFKPVLYPIYRELLNQIDSLVIGKQYKVFDTGYGVQDIQHEQTDRLYWGAAADDNKNPFNDRLDAIELKMNLKIYERNC